MTERTYTEPQKWMRGKGRVTIQFGCCYNYATVLPSFENSILSTIFLYLSIAEHPIYKKIIVEHPSVNLMVKSIMAG
jgi:hypothetical protein